MQNHHILVWFEIPVTNIERAESFYQAVLGRNTGDIPGFQGFRYFQHEDNQVAGGLCVFEDRKPSQNGPLIYLNVAERMDEALIEVEKNGGKIVEPKNKIGEYGYRAIILDTEGNKIALHSYE